MAELDPYGISTLEVISEAPRFNEWMYQTIKPFCKGKVLELGSGIGNISSHFIHDGFDITLSDLRQNYQQYLRDHFKLDSDRVRSIDMVDAEFDQKHKDLIASFDTVFALNVVEHIEDHRLAMTNATRLIKPRGHLIILVPAYQSLYNHFDTDLGHYRRFTKKTLRQHMPSELVEEIKMSYFNFVGIFGWFVSGKLMGNKHISADSMRTYNKLMPIIRVADQVMLRSMGLSVWFVAKKK